MCCTEESTFDVLGTSRRTQWSGAQGILPPFPSGYAPASKNIVFQMVSDFRNWVKWLKWKDWLSEVIEVKILHGSGQYLHGKLSLQKFTKGCTAQQYHKNFVAEFSPRIAGLFFHEFRVRQSPEMSGIKFRRLRFRSCVRLKTRVLPWLQEFEIN